jgi:hypothetical protein
MRANRLNLAIALIGTIVLFSCKKKTEELQTDSLLDYVRLQSGKYITYRLDSTVFVNFGRDVEIHSFQEKHLIDSQLTDALGRTGYRVFRFLRDTLGTGPWEPAGSYMITPTDNTIEFVENNLRFVKLILPVKQDITWKGHRYFPDEPYSPIFSFQNDFDMSDWEYTYSSLGESIVLNGQAINDVLTVDGINLSSNVPVTDLNSYGFIDYMQDRYAKGIGLVYQEFIMWDYQPPNGTVTTGYKTGFGIKRSMIDHN